MLGGSQVEPPTTPITASLPKTQLHNYTVDVFPSTYYTSVKILLIGK